MTAARRCVRASTPRAATITATPDRHWDYLPTYLAKLAYVRGYLDAPAGRHPRARRRLRRGRARRGVRASGSPSRASIPNYDVAARAPGVADRAARIADGAFDRVLCLDVLEHLDLRGPAARRSPRSTACSRPDGEALISVPNLAHLQSRVHFLLRGPADPHGQRAQAPGRPARGRVPRGSSSGRASRSSRRRGIFPTIPVLTALDPPPPVDARLAAPAADARCCPSRAGAS